MEVSFRSLQKVIYIFRNQCVGGVKYAALFDFLNFPTSGVIIGVRKNFVFPAQCYSTPRIYIYETPAKLNGLKPCPFRRTN